MKHFFIIWLSFIIATSGFAQAFDALPYHKPDWATYFQQEMTSLMRFQAANNMNVPFFASYSGRGVGFDYNRTNFESMYSEYPGYLVWSNGEPADTGHKLIFEQYLVTGFQIKVNNALYIPVLVSGAMIDYSNVLEEYTYTYNGTEYTTPVEVQGDTIVMYAGSGVFINTDVIKGGIYMGWQGVAEHRNIISPVYFKNNPGSFRNDSTWDGGKIEKEPSMINRFNIALVPLINTSDWAFVGKALDTLLGYFGLGDALMDFGEQGDSKTAALAGAINAALDFTFNRIHLGTLSLDAQAMYTRGNFDMAAKADTYGAKVTGLFSGFPFGFILEGGYKHFYSVSKFFIQDYPDTGYFNGSIFFPFKNITFGFIYGYDNIYKSKFTIALSTNYLSGLITLNDHEQYRDKTKFDKQDFPGNVLGGLGARFRWGGWNVGK